MRLDLSPAEAGAEAAASSMSSADAAWLRMDRPTNLMVINGVLWFDEPVDHVADLAVAFCLQGLTDAPEPKRA